MPALDPLLQALRRRDLLPGRGLSESAVQESLRCLASLLATLVRSLTPGAAALDPAGWNKAQVDFVLATAQAVLAECIHQPSEAGVTEVVEKIAQLTIQLCIGALENLSTRLKSNVSNWCMLLLELVAGGDVTKERGLTWVDSSSHMIPDFSLLEIDNTSLEELVHIHGTKCLLEGLPIDEKAVEISDDIIALLVSDDFAVDDNCTRKSYKSQGSKQGKDIMSATQHFAVVHFSCHKRLINVCKEMLLEPLIQEESQHLEVRISLASRILKLLASLSKSYNNFPFAKELAISTVDVAACLPAFFKYSPSERDEDVENQETHLPTLLSSFLYLAEVIFQDDHIIQNLRTFFAARILDIMDVKQDKPLERKEVLIHAKPEIISCFLGLVNHIHVHGFSSYPAHLTWNKVGLGDIDLPLYQLQSQPFLLNESRSREKCLQIIFPLDGNWLDKLLGVIRYLFVRGMDLMKGIEKLHHQEGLAGSLADHASSSTEDDALFGNLFSESGRHSPNSEGCSQTSLSEKKLSGPHTLPFQTVIDILGFLKNCIFSSDWQRLIFESACKQLNGNHINVLLQIISHERENVLNMSDNSNILIHVEKLSFYLLHSLVSNRILSERLEEHLFSQILERCSSGCNLSHNPLTVVAKLLINRSGCFSKDHDYRLHLQLWQSFIDTVSSEVENTSRMDMPIQKACANLPSLFYIEVLLMAFHSLQVSARILIMQRLVFTLINLCNGTNDANGCELTVKSLLLSRLVMVLRYAFLYFRVYPRWVLEHMRSSLRYCSQEDMTSSELKINPMFYLTAITAESIKEGGLFGEHYAICEEFLIQLFDVSGFFSSKGVDDLVDLNDSRWEALRLCDCLCLFLERWRGKPVRGVDELVAERYVFFLCWTIVNVIRQKVKPALPQDSHCQGCSPFSADFFINISQSFIGPLNIEGTKNSDYPAGTLLEALSSCVTVLSNKEAVDIVTWNFLRFGSVLNLLFLILQASFAKIIVQAGGLVSEDWAVRILEVPVQSLCDLMEDFNLILLLRNLSSLLQFYIESHLDCMLNTFVDQKLCQSTQFSIRMLMQTGISRSKLEELFAILGISFPFVQSLLKFGDPTSWRERNISRVSEAGFTLSPMNRIFACALLHGYPSCLHPASAAAISCTMIIEGILETIRLVLKAQILASNFDTQGCEQVKICVDLFEKVTLISFNSSFEAIHPKCNEVRDLLLSSREEQLRFSDLCLLKQQASVLTFLSSGSNANELVRDELVICVVDAINILFRDASRVNTLKEHFLLGHQQLFLLVDVLDGCHQESINLKVLQLLADLSEHAGLKGALQEKILSMDVVRLSFWLVQKLLGCKPHHVEGTSSVSTVSNSVRELAGSFLSSLVSPVLASNKKDVRSHILNALLLNFDEAYNSFDASSFRGYFTFLIQIANKEPQLKLVLKSVFQLLGKLPNEGSSLDGLKYLISFLSSALSVCSAQKVQAQHKALEGRHWPTSIAGSRVGMGGRTKHVVLKNSELLAAVEQSGNVTTVDCDATSADDDEDDATSDGEIMSVDKDEDDEGNSGEKVLASRVCTFTSSGSNYMEQHWYFCYTCDLTVTKGCCSICARVCHRGHKVVYSRLSRFFCDCGAGGVRGMSCLCLKPRKYVSPSSTVSSTGASVSESFLPLADDQDHALPSDSDSDIDEETCHDIERAHKISIDEGEDKLLSLLSDLDIEGNVLSLLGRLLSSLILDKKICKGEEFHLGEDKILIVENGLMQLKRVYKSGSFDMKIKTDYPNARELRSQISSGSLVKSLLSVNSRGRLAVGEGDKVAIYDVGQLIGQPGTGPVTIDKTTMKPLSVKNPVRFEVIQLIFNGINESYLAVAGYEDCQIFTVNPRGEVIDRLAIDLSLQDAYIRHVSWVPGSQVQLMVVTNKFVKIYDLSQDNISPVHYFTVFEDCIADATLFSGRGQLILIVFSEQGLLFSQNLSEKTHLGPHIIMDTIQIPEKYQLSKGISIYFSHQYRLLFLSYSEGLCMIGRLNPEATTFTEISSISEVDQDGKTKMAGLHQWKEAFDDNGLFVCLSNLKSSSAVAVCVGPSKLQAQHLKFAGGSGTPRVDGFATYRTMTRERNNLLILYDDGSLQVFSFNPHSSEKDCESARQSSNLEAEQVKKWGAALLDNKLSSSVAPIFPLDFFEKTTCITADIKLGGDILHSGDSEAVKLSLASEDGFLEAPNPTGFKIVVFNSNPDTVMVGCRVHVGNTSTSRIPCEICIFQRSIKLEEGVRCWYDIPFTNTEALLADEQFTLMIGPTFNNSSSPRIDCLEVYGRSKDDFGWKEKLDAVLDMEARNSGAGSTTVGAKYKNLQNASILEQILADTFRLLSGYYVAFRTCVISDLNEDRFDASRKRCQQLLELVFENDRHPYLQSAARRLLHALYPSKDTYYQAKDTLRLTVVSHVCKVLEVKIQVGGCITAGAIKDFISQMRVVCKISLDHRSNLTSFLERYGPSVIEDTMKVFWEILFVEKLDAQTINNLVTPAVDLIYGYTECLVSNANVKAPPGTSVIPINLCKQLLFAPSEAVRTFSSLAMSSRLLEVPSPKHTVLAIDDISESVPVTSLPPESDGIIQSLGHTLMEDDVSTASVQYCCDGCSTVPIIGHRWHCNICPDFDLCEACYQVMDPDRLIPPHLKDHPMSAIPIEAESLGGERQFSSIDELSDENLLQVHSEISLQSASARVNSTIDANECENYVQNPASELKAVTISASKRAVNYLLIRNLLEETRGWMHSTSGMRAISFMQFLYRLASTPSGPFVNSSLSDSLDLKGLIALMLEEINLSAPLSAKSRSSFGEVVILTFIFFNLMLRNWHQPTSDNSHVKPGVIITLSGTPASSGSGSPSSNDSHDRDAILQLDRACAVLRQQQLVNYLFSIIQQFVHVYKSSSKNQESLSTNAMSPACSALLSVRKEFVAGSFTPFFTDSYAKSHRGDLFEDFHRILLENAFRLTYSLVRPEKKDKLNEREQSSCKGPTICELKLDGWQELLCTFINNPHTTFIRKHARRLLLHLCGTKGHYYSVRDAWQLNKEVKRLYKLIQKSGALQGVISYERIAKLVKCLLSIVEVASARPQNWQKYCSRQIDVLQFLLKVIFYFEEESVIQMLKLLALAYYSGKEVTTKVDQGDPSSTAGVNNTSTSLRTRGQTDGRKKRKGACEDVTDTVLEKTFLDMEVGVELLAAGGGSILRRFVDVFLLEWNSTSVRSEAKNVLYGAWFHGRDSTRGLILTSLMQKVPVLPSFGQNIVEYTHLLTWIIDKGVSESVSRETELVQSCLTIDVVKGVFETLCAQNGLLANHPNSRIYNTLSSLVEFDGYYLESEPCLACSCPEVPYTRMKLENLKSETKFTDNRILVKCIGSHAIQSVTMNVHEPRSKTVKVLNLYYNNKPVADLSELKNNRSLWKRVRSCHLGFNQTELKIEFPIPITACNLMIELDSFYENLQASSLESLLCPRCSRNVTDKHGICSNCHENAYQCRQCRNINYENLDSFLCNECGFSKYGKFEFVFMAKLSFSFDPMESDEDMKKGLSAIEAESENAHRRYQQLLGFKKPLLKLVSSIGESEMDAQQKDSVQQMIVSLPGSSSFKINRKIAILGVLYGEKCKMAFDSVSRSVQTLQGLRRVLTNYLERKRDSEMLSTERLVAPRPSNRCYGCANTFVGHCLEWLQVIAKMPRCKQQLIEAGILLELFENNMHQGTKSVRIQSRAVLSILSGGDATAVAQLNSLIKQKVLYCLEHHRSIDIAACIREELQLLSECCMLADEFWETRLRLVFQLLFSSIKVGSHHPAISEHIILACLKIIAQACTPPKSEANTSSNSEARIGEPVNPLTGVKPEERLEERSKSSNDVQMSHNSSISKAQFSCEKDIERDSRGHDIPLVNYAEWKGGATYLDFVRRQYTIIQNIKPVVQKHRRDSRRADYLALKYLLRWKRRACKLSVTNEFAAFEESSWVCELVLSACSQAIRVEICGLIGILCSQSPGRCSKFLNLLMVILPATRSAGESAAEYFELLYKMIEQEDARLYLTVRGFLSTLCVLISEEVARLEAQEHSFHIDISQGYILHKLIELLEKFLQISNIRARFMKEGLLTQALDAFVVIKGLVVHKTKLITDCGHLLKELLSSLLQESYENKRHFVRACIAGFQRHGKSKKDRSFVFLLEQLCNIICPSKPVSVYQMVLNKAHTQEEFIRGSMTKNPYSSADVGPLMRDVKNKICLQLDLLGLLEDDYGMELLVAGNIICLDLSIAQVYEQVWQKAQSQTSGSTGTTCVSLPGATSGKECPPMIITYRLQGLDGEATEPMIKELEDDREESQDPEVEFAIAGVMRESNGLKTVIDMVQMVTEEEIKSNHELALILRLLMYCCKVRENRQALLHLGALGMLLEKARRAFSVDAIEPAEGLLLIVECLVTEAIESDIGAAELSLGVSKGTEGAGDQAAHATSMFLDRLSYPSCMKKSGKQQKNSDMVARILPYLTYGEQTAIEVLVNHFDPYLHNWGAFDELMKKHQENVKDECLEQQAAEHHLALENFVKVTESIKINAHGDKIKSLIMEKGIPTAAVRYLKDVFSVYESGCDYKGTVEWACGLELPSVPIILSILRGLSRGHPTTQKCLEDEGLLPLLHALEGVSGENEIGARAENLLDTLADKEGKGEGFLAEKVSSLRHATRDEMRRRALRKREELLQGLGMHRECMLGGGERIVVSKLPIEGLEEVEEEQAGLACMVCREGYSLRPTDMLGTYCYSKRVNLGLGPTSNARAEWVYTTVSHFNVIHFQCHEEAKKADASLKNPKKEWDGATLRNNETLCNNLFPLRGPSVPLSQYARCVEQHWDNLNTLGRADGSRLRLLTYDIVLMLARFATGASFSADSKGGGKESNSRLLPFMVQMARHLLDQAGAGQRRAQAKLLLAYLALPSPESPGPGSKSSPSAVQRLGAVDETVQFMMVQSLLLESLHDWQQHRWIFLQRGIYNAYQQYKHGRALLTTTPLPSHVPSPRTPVDVTSISLTNATEKEIDDTNGSCTDREHIFNAVQPTLVYTGLVNRLQRYLKHEGSTAGELDIAKHRAELASDDAVEEGYTRHGVLESWDAVVKERLTDIKAMLGFSKELLEWLDEMQAATSLQEAFDIMGALGDVSSRNFSSCEDFVWDAVNAGFQ